MSLTIGRIEQEQEVEFLVDPYIIVHKSGIHKCQFLNVWYR